jgi:hypothetical protein
MTKAEDVLDYIYHNPGTTQTKLIKGFGHQFFDATPQYGSQRQASSIIAALRRDGLVNDVSKRCPTCGAARTRGKRNVKLFVTENGVERLETLGVTITKAS